MIISTTHRYIYLAVPKTGTTSIEKWLLEVDSTASKQKAVLEGKSYKFRGHATALEVKNTLGSQYGEFQVIGFMRHPYSRIVSSYFFYQKGAKNWLYEGGKKKRTYLQKFQIALAKWLPFKIWALIYPYRSNREYFQDEQGNLIVGLIGTYENLMSDLSNIFSIVGTGFDISTLPYTNKSQHERADHYFQAKWFRYLIDLKVRKDMGFYQEYANNLTLDVPKI